MKKLVIIFLLGAFGITKVNAQATTASNTILSTNYLGSANDLDVLFKRNNINAGKISVTSVFFGLNSGLTSSGNGNTFFGTESGRYNGSGVNNVYIGDHSGNANIGSNNTFVGGRSGMNFNYGGSTYIGSGNVFLGAFAGSDLPETTNNRLLIANNQNGSGLIWGDFALQHLKFNSKVGINGDEIEGYFGNFPTTAGSVNVSNYSLFVKGGILAEEVRVSLKSTWADYVFKKDYKLPTLAEVEKQIQQKGHLANVPSAEQIKTDGIEVGEMAKIQMEKIEELTLYIIEQNKINEKQNSELKKQNKEIEELKTALKVLLQNK